MELEPIDEYGIEGLAGRISELLVERSDLRYEIAERLARGQVSLWESGVRDTRILPETRLAVTQLSRPVPQEQSSATRVGPKKIANTEEEYRRQAEDRARARQSIAQRDSGASALLGLDESPTLRSGRRK